MVVRFEQYVNFLETDTSTMSFIAVYENETLDAPDRERAGYLDPWISMKRAKYGKFWQKDIVMKNECVTPLAE